MSDPKYKIYRTLSGIEKPRTKVNNYRSPMQEPVQKMYNQVLTKYSKRIMVGSIVLSALFSAAALHVTDK
jgi:hypothetical protein